MYRITIIAAVLFFSVYTLSGQTWSSGRSNNDFVQLDEFEQSFNFYYKSIKDTIFYNTAKEKEKSLIATVNIAFYDVNNDSTFLLFGKNSNYKIDAVFYEDGYAESSSMIVFTNRKADYRCEIINGNSNIEQRELSKNIFIVSYSYVSQKYILWSVRKNGVNLRQLSEFSTFCSLKYDAKNRNFIVLEEAENHNSRFRKIDY